MRSKLLNITSRLLGVLIVIAVTIVNSSCSDTETTDSTKFTIYYTGMTDIGPSMTGVISSPDLQRQCSIRFCHYQDHS